MFCKNCGKEINDNTSFCPNCGTNVVQNSNQNNFTNNSYNQYTNQSQQNNLFSIIGLIVAGISLLLNFWGIVGIAAVILSTIGLIQINKTQEKGKGFAIAGIAIGSFSILYGFIMIMLMM